MLLKAMRGTLFKRLFVLLAVFALVGGPWAQAMAQGSAQRCPVSPFAAATDVAVSQAVPCDMPAHMAGGGKTMSTACAQDCLAQINLVMPAAEMHFEALTPAFEAEVAVAIDGHAPEPELSPPIALI